MRRGVLCIILLVTLSAGVVHAARVETLVYELTDVIGDYPRILPDGDLRFDRSQIIEYHGPLAHIETMRVVATGESESGLIVCNLFPEQYDTTVTGMALVTSVKPVDRFELWMSGTDVVYQGGFSSLNHLRPLVNLSFAYLRDGESYRVSQSLGPEGFVAMCWDLLYPEYQEGRITSAVLYIDVTYPIGTESTTWGRIKSLYR